MTNRGVRGVTVIVRIGLLGNSAAWETKGRKKGRRGGGEKKKKKNPFDGMVERLPMHTRPRMLAHVHAKMRLIINFAFTFYIQREPARIARFCKLVRRGERREMGGVHLPCWFEQRCLSERCIIFLSSSSSSFLVETRPWIYKTIKLKFPDPAWHFVLPFPSPVFPRSERESKGAEQPLRLRCFPPLLLLHPPSYFILWKWRRSRKVMKY